MDYSSKTWQARLDRIEKFAALQTRVIPKEKAITNGK